jgi:hypothetical protein
MWHLLNVAPSHNLISFLRTRLVENASHFYYRNALLRMRHLKKKKKKNTYYCTDRWSMMSQVMTMAG